MKLLIASTAVVLFYSGIGLAQMPGDRPAATDSSAVSAAGNERKHARQPDARHCLAQKDDRAIIRCAERYRYRASSR